MEGSVERMAVRGRMPGIFSGVCTLQYLTLAVFLTGIIVTGFAVWSHPEPGIVYEGRAVDDWLNSGYEDASRAMHDIGPAAVPAIFSKLRREHPRFGYWPRYRIFWHKIPAFIRAPLPTPRTVCFDEWRASQVLIAIGPRVVPSLVTRLRDPSPLVRVVSAQALGGLAERGADIQGAAPALRRALGDRDREVRLQAGRALARTRFTEAVASAARLL